jgi:hypothetical protein
MSCNKKHQLGSKASLDFAVVWLIIPPHQFMHTVHSLHISLQEVGVGAPSHSLYILVDITELHDTNALNRKCVCTTANPVHSSDGGKVRGCGKEDEKCWTLLQL